MISTKVALIKTRSVPLLTLVVSRNTKVKVMIEEEILVPAVVWYSKDIEAFEWNVHKNIVNDVIAEILDDCVHCLKDCAVNYTSKGRFKIVVFDSESDIVEICENLESIIDEYEVQNYE